MTMKELLMKLVSINSVYPAEESSPERPGEEEIAVFIEERLKDLDFATP